MRIKMVLPSEGNEVRRDALADILILGRGGDNLLYDVFICHASEDKESFVRPLAEKLRNLHVEVWYDEFSLDIGDSIRESIDKGLAKSRYGIVVLSKNFFKKRWPQRELNGLTAREMSSENNNVLLPVWHNITVEEILEFSPPLADRKAIVSNLGLDHICKELIRKLRPQESPLIVAQNELIHFGLRPPVVTDEWWLDVIEASKKIPSWGFVPPEDSSWGNWTFPLPNFQEKGEARGVRLAWTAMQMQWEREAERQRITQTTRPEKVFEFIDSQPGLNEICHDYPRLLAAYAPQITIPGLSGEFEEDFNMLMTKQKYIELSLRYENFGGFEAGSVACNFVQGELGGPDVKYYDNFEYVVWLLSNDSTWLPTNTRDFLIRGMKEWGVWFSSRLSFSSNVYFLRQLMKAKNERDFKFTPKTKHSLLNWIEDSIQELGIYDNFQVIMDKFLKEGFIESYLRDKNEGRRR